MQRLRNALAAGLAAAAAAAAASADAPAGPDGLPVPAIESCVGTGPRIAFGIADSRALLEPSDRDRVLAAMLERYPVLDRDGFAPLHILLWHKIGGEWLYVSLSANDGDPPALCFTATFLADDFEFTGDLIEKYFAVGAAST